MRELRYRHFSLNRHLMRGQRGMPSVCQFELTFKCPLHCRHCYTDCFNRPPFFKKEVSFAQIKDILDGLWQIGIPWLCFTGGDPLTRKDFLEAYAYAKQKGFIITVFTTACSVDKRIMRYLSRHPPFQVEITFNGATRETFDHITQVAGSYEKSIATIKLMRKASIPLKLKTQVTKDNVHEYARIKRVVESLGLRFYPTLNLHARLDHNTSPCRLRVPLKDALQLFPISRNSAQKSAAAQKRPPRLQPLFSCAVTGGDSVIIDPYGNMVSCICLREPKISLLSTDIYQAHLRLLAWLRAQRFTSRTKCRFCDLRESCLSCPGKAFLEMRDREVAIPYFCELAHATGVRWQQCPA